MGDYEYVFGNTKSYADLPEEVKSKLTEKEVESLQELQKDFIASAEYINEILYGDDIETNLDYLIRDWLGEHDGQGFRNDSILFDLRIINEAHKKVQKQEAVEA